MSLTSNTPYLTVWDAISLGWHWKMLPSSSCGYSVRLRPANSVCFADNFKSKVLEVIEATNRINVSVSEFCPLAVLAVGSSADCVVAVVLIAANDLFRVLSQVMIIAPWKTFRHCYRSVSLPMGVSSLEKHIASVVNWIPKKEMAWVTTKRVIAGVARKLSHWPFSSCDVPGNNVSPIRLAGNTEDTVRPLARSIQRSLPGPAFCICGDRQLRPESLDVVIKKVGWC